MLVRGDGDGDSAGVRVWRRNWWCRRKLGKSVEKQARRFYNGKALPGTTASVTTFVFMLLRVACWVPGHSSSNGYFISSPACSPPSSPKRAKPCTCYVCSWGRWPGALVWCTTISRGVSSPFPNKLFDIVREEGPDTSLAKQPPCMLGELCNGFVVQHTEEGERLGGVSRRNGRRPLSISRPATLESADSSFPEARGAQTHGVDLRKKPADHLFNTLRSQKAAKDLRDCPIQWKSARYIALLGRVRPNFARCSPTC